MGEIKPILKLYSILIFCTGIDNKIVNCKQIIIMIGFNYTK